MDYYTYIGMDRVDLGNWVPHIPQKNERLSRNDFQKTTPTKNPKDIWIIPDLFEEGDYIHGGPVTLSNHNVFLQLYGKWTGIHDLYGNFGYYGIAIRSDVLSRHPEVQETLDELKSYPVLDEDDLSKTEIKIQDKAWNDYIQEDLIQNVQKEDPRLENIDTDTINWFTLCRIAMEETNTEWLPEGNTYYLDIYKITPHVTEMALTQILPPKQLILEIGREWTSKHARTMFEESIKSNVSNDL